MHQRFVVFVTLLLAAISLTAQTVNPVSARRAAHHVAAHEAQVRQMVALYAEAVSGSQVLIAAVRSGKSPDLAAFEEKMSSLGSRADAIAVDLGATACGA